MELVTYLQYKASSKTKAFLPIFCWNSSVRNLKKNFDEPNNASDIALLVSFRSYQTAETNVTEISKIYLNNEQNTFLIMIEDFITFVSFCNVRNFNLF